MSLLKIKTPMLANKVTTEINFKDKVFIQPKLDGVRCYITKNGAFSRNHKQFMNAEHILEALKPLFEYQPNLILDGELYNHDLKNDFNKIISLVRKQKPTEADKQEAKELMQFHWYDTIDDSKQDSRDVLRGLLYKIWIDDKKTIRNVDSQSVASQDDISMMHRQYKLQGYEGSIVRLNGQYEQKRSKNLMKVKDWHDTEITVTGYVEGKGKFEGGLGKFLGRDEDGREVEVPFPNLTIPKRRDYWKRRKSFIGKELTFEYFERTPDGAYRFPRAKAFRSYE